MDDLRIERARGNPEGRADEILSFWAEHGGPRGEVAQRRLREVVCVLLGADGNVAGVNSVHEDRVAAIGGRRFWIYRALLSGAASEAADAAMVDAAHEALAEEFAAGDGDDPIGLCVLIADAAAMRRRPETVWPGAGLIYAGYTADDRQIRLGYFEGARV